MSRELDKRPSMDYEELRRRHEMYKSRTRKAAPQPARQVKAAAAPQPDTPVRSAPVGTAATENVAAQPVQPVETVSAAVAETVAPVAETVAEKAQEIAQAVDIPEEQPLEAPLEVDPADAEPVRQAEEIEAPLDEVFEDAEETEPEFVDDELNDVFSDDELEDEGEEEEDAPDTNPFAQFISIYHNARDFFRKRRAAKKGDADVDEPNYEDEFADLEDEDVFETED